MNFASVKERENCREYKNMQRRTYDCINVLEALKIVTKNKGMKEGISYNPQNPYKSIIKHVSLIALVTLNRWLIRRSSPKIRALHWLKPPRKACR